MRSAISSLSVQQAADSRHAKTDSNGYTLAGSVDQARPSSFTQSIFNKLQLSGQH